MCGDWPRLLGPKACFLFAGDVYFEATAPCGEPAVEEVAWLAGDKKEIVGRTRVPKRSGFWFSA